MPRKVGSIAAYLHYENKNQIASKFMSILNFEIERNQIYDSIRKFYNSKMIVMLLIQTFQSFTFHG